MTELKRSRRQTRPVAVGDIIIGGEAPLSIQSMTSIPLEDVTETINQINALADEGAEIIRLAVRNSSCLENLKQVRQNVKAMLTADIHFDYRLAIGAIEAGINKVRINPGNIGERKRVSDVVKAARDHGVPIRIGVNGGSLDRSRFPEGSPADLAESAMEHVRILEDEDFQEIVVSIKSSDIYQTIEANKIFSKQRDYPLHIGLTEAGFGLTCIVQSSIAMGHLLMEGIGDTLRVSMTGDPVEEVRIAKKILEALGERSPIVRIISCPTCGRTDPELDILDLAQKVEESCIRNFGERLRASEQSLTIAVMGCEVNGPGEAAHADFGLAGARKGRLLLFSKGEKLGLVDAGNAVEALIDRIRENLR